MTQNPSRLGFLPALLGLVVVGTYITSSMGYFPGPEKLLILLFFAIGPVAIIGSLAVRRRLIQRRGTAPDCQRAAASPGLADFWVEVGTVFFVIGFALMNLMLVVQIYVRQRVKERLYVEGEEALGEQAQESLREIWRVVDLVQQGIDVSFDIFYCLGLLLVAAAMVHHPDFGKVLGWFGMLVSVPLLALNLGAFPHIPGETGLVDLGPVSALWWVAVIVQLIRLDWRERKAGVTAAAT